MINEKPTVRIERPAWARRLWEPSRYKILYGGRGSGKSWGVGQWLVICAAQQHERILCAREYQETLDDSVYHVLSMWVQAMKLDWSRGYRIMRDKIVHRKTDSEFIFRGLRRNPHSLKSIDGLTKAWVEEAHTITKVSWELLKPTIRAPSSEIICTLNRTTPEDVLNDMIEHPPDNALVMEVNWRDNPFFPEVLEEERRAMLATDPDYYQHVWEGEPLRRTDAQVLGGKWVVADFETDRRWHGPYYGLDWGFANDPLAAVELYIDPHANRLMVTREAGRTRLDLDETPRYLRAHFPGIEDYIVRADNARPESVSYIKRHANGISRIASAPKWPGSVKDGIQFLRSFSQIVIHASCVQTQREARLYSYKVDKLTEEVLPDIIDANNHFIDAMRYGLSPLIARSRRKQAGTW